MEHDDKWDASSVASSSDTVCSTSQGETITVETINANACLNMDVIQKLDLMKSDFATKIDGVLTAIQDFKKDIRYFSGHMDMVEEHISNVEDAVNSEKSKKQLNT